MKNNNGCSVFNGVARKRTVSRRESPLAYARRHLVNKLACVVNTEQARGVIVYCHNTD
jgi:hypothetical protein